jgi:hypothetical protein
MKVAAVIVAAALAYGCSHTTINANSSASTGPAAPTAGTTTTGGSVSVHAHSRSLAALVIAGMFIAAAVDYSREPRPAPSFSEFADWFRGAPPPRELDSGRRISEQDCTRPLDYSLGNIRCK